MWQRIYALMIKEFLALLKDKMSRSVIIVPPIMQLLVFSYAATFDLREIPYAVFNEDGGAASRELLAGFSGSPNFRELGAISHEDEIAPLIDSRKALLVIHIGPTFSRDLLTGSPGPVQIIVDGRNSNTALIVLNYARTITNGFNQSWNESRQNSGPVARLVTRAWFNPNLESRWFIVPGIVGLLTLVVTMLVTALSVAREREQGTFDQLLVTPLRPFEILVGKVLPGIIIGGAEASVIVLAAVLWFKVPLRGSIFSLYTGILLFLFSSAGVGLMISSLAVTMQQGLLGAFMFLVPSIILSGFATPISNMPPLVQHITLLNPMRYFMFILRGVFIEGTPFHLLLGQFWPLAAIALINLTLAAYLFRRRMY